MLWFVEVFIWLLILVSVSGLLMFAKYNYRKNFNTYQIFLPDVDGLIEGSPVKLMGIQIGYVNQINIIGDDVYVKFIITEQNVKIPRGSVATVEFSGLGGSKSLELYPPQKKKKYISDRLLVPEQPKRIRDALGLLDDMFEKIISITYTCSNFMDKVGIIPANKEKLKDNIKKENSTGLDNANNWLDRATEQTVKFNKKLLKMREKKNDGHGSNKGNQ